MNPADGGVWFAPGRANLMGEHTDYNEGLVLPFALARGVTATVTRRDDGLLVMRSAQMPGDVVTAEVSGLSPAGVHGWAAYPAGVAWALRAADVPVPGATIEIDSDLPVGAGVSSSAALECAVALGLREISGAALSRRVLAAVARQAENEFVGAPTGIIDQHASLLCEAGHAMLLDCASRSIIQVPFCPSSAGVASLVIDTRVAHSLSDGAYARRRAECEEAARQLGVPFLGQVTSVAGMDRLEDPVLRRRARHVVSDSVRARAIATALSESGAGPDDAYRHIGELLTEGHASLRDDFEVSWPEADVTVRTAIGAGAYGAKMIGGGFGGSVLALIPTAKLDAVCTAVTGEFTERSWSTPEFLDAVPSPPARRVGLPGWICHSRSQNNENDISIGWCGDAVTGTVRDDADAIADDITELRHALHREPEIGLDLPKTQRKVLGALGGLPLEVTTGERLSSVTAVLRGRRPESPTVLLRGDMDALPVREQSGVEYASRTDGAMHACGHDLHTAMLAGAARILSARKDKLNGNVIFMFQPGEEGLGGAKYMLEEDVLEAAGPGTRPVAAYGLHVFSDIPHGRFETRPGPLMASSDAIDVTVRGRGGHASMPHRNADPVPVICEIVTALQTLVTRKFDIFDPVVLSVGSLHAGTARNVIPDEASFEGTARSFSEEARSRMEEESVRSVRNIALAHGLEAEARYERRYPVTANDPAETAFAIQAAREMFGEGRAATRPYPLAGGEDFSYILQNVPGTFVFLGACPPETDFTRAPSNHSARAVFDDGVLADGAALLAELALRRLS